VTSATAPGRATPGPGPMIVDRPEGRNAVVKLFVFVPFLALVAAVPFAWGWGLSWVDVGLATSFYFFTCAGATVGVPPLLHPPRVQGHPTRAGRAGRGGQHGKAPVSRASAYGCIGQGAALKKNKHGESEHARRAASDGRAGLRTGCHPRACGGKDVKIFSPDSPRVPSADQTA
jgi:hypothetical protein